MRRGERGFTLLELLIALAIVGALLAVAFGGLRVAAAAWRQGEDRAEAHQHARGLAVVLARALGAAYPYRAPLGLGPDATLLFQGTERRLEFVTAATPFPFAVPVAFTAVSISLDEGERPGLVVRQRPLPNREPFAEAAVAFHDLTVTALAFAYLDADGAWRESWDGGAENGTPRAIRLTLGTSLGGRAQTLPPLTVSLRVNQ
jgi:prepilin-type N-terminal cleavage/methylation domain-containing protein